MYNVYILYSKPFDKFYVGISDDPHRRLVEHNNSPHNTFTSKYRPWELFLYFETGNSLGFALKVEKKVKKQKNRDFYYTLLHPKYRNDFLSSVG
jgi:putative endonuclease